jgi:hypothetical protein
MALRQTKKERFSAALIHLKEIKTKLGKMHNPPIAGYELGESRLIQR